MPMTIVNSAMDNNLLVPGALSRIFRVSIGKFPEAKTMPEAKTNVGPFPGTDTRTP